MYTSLYNCTDKTFRLIINNSNNYNGQSWTIYKCFSPVIQSPTAKYQINI